MQHFMPHEKVLSLDGGVFGALSSPLYLLLETCLAAASQQKTMEEFYFISLGTLRKMGD
jgi:hypothetical protein